MSNVIVIGGGAAGMMAAYSASLCGHVVTLIEKNEKLGKKIYITGKGRCNVTNACDIEDLFSNVRTNEKFLYSAFYTFDNNQVIDFFETHGMATKIERGNRVFPVSDHSSDVISTLQKVLKQKNVKIMLNTEVKKIRFQEGTTENSWEVVLSDNTFMSADSLIIATGGLSYPSTGSTGDGYKFAEETGHAVTDCTPSLVPFNVKEKWVPKLQGLALKNTAISIFDNNKMIYSDFGEMLFTHFGVSGPMILSASATIKQKSINKPLNLYIDLKPALDEDTLDKRILREFDDAKNKQFKNSINKLLPAKLLPVIIELSEINPHSFL